MRSLLSLLLLTIGCTEAMEGAESAAPEREATPWQWSDTATSTAFDAVAYASDIQSVVDVIPTYRPEPLFDSYAAARGMGAPPCPPEDALDQEGVLNTWWYGACVSDAGVHFNGVMTAWGWSGVDISTLGVTDMMGLAQPGYLYTGRGFEGRIDIYDAAGTGDFSCSCEAVAANGVAPDGRQLRLNYARGPAAWTGPEAAGTWMDSEEVRASVALWADSNSSGGGWALHVMADESGKGDRYRAHVLVADLALSGDRTHCTAMGGALKARDTLTAEWQEHALLLGTEGSCQACVEIDEASVCWDMTPILTEATARWW